MVPSRTALRLATVRVLVSVYGLIWLLAAAPLLYGCIDFPAADRFESVPVPQEALP